MTAVRRKAASTLMLAARRMCGGCARSEWQRAHQSAYRSRSTGPPTGGAADEAAITSDSNSAALAISTTAPVLAVEAPAALLSARAGGSHSR
eukprot:1771581-Prymnesium_polylepis.1